MKAQGVKMLSALFLQPSFANAALHRAKSWEWLAKFNAGTWKDPAEGWITVAHLIFVICAHPRKSAAKGSSSPRLRVAVVSLWRVLVF